MPEPTNSELFGAPGDRVLRLELLPYPAVTYEEHLNTNFLLEIQRFGLLVEHLLGAVKTQGYDVIVDGSDVKVTAGLLFFKKFLVQESTDVVVAPLANEDRKLILKVTEVKKTFETHQSEVEVSVEGRLLSGPNQKTYQVEYLYQTGTVPSDTATESYLHLADIAQTGDVTKQVPSRDELLHELDSGEQVLTDQNFKVLETDLKQFFTEKTLDFGQGVEKALFVDLDKTELSGEALLLRVEGIKPMSFASDPDFVGSSIFQNGMGTRASVEFAWGYQTTDADGGNGTVELFNAGFNTNSGVTPTFTADQLVGYRLFFDGEFFTITANTATSLGSTVVSVENSAGSTPDLTGRQASSSNIAVVDNKGQEYELVAEDGAGTTHQTIISLRQGATSSPVQQRGFLELDLGQEYKIVLNSFSVLRFDVRKQELPSGTVGQWGTETYTYAASPAFIPGFANIPTVAPISISSINGDPQRMRVVVGGNIPSAEDLAEAYELIWNVNPEGDNTAALNFEAGGFEFRAIVHNFPEFRGQEKKLFVEHGIPDGTTRDIHMKYRAIVGSQVTSAVQELTQTLRVNNLPAPQNVSAEFLEHGLFEQFNFDDFFVPESFPSIQTSPAAVKVTWDPVVGARGYNVSWKKLDASDSPIDGTFGEKTLLLGASETDTIGTDGAVIPFTLGRKIRLNVAAVQPNSTLGERSTVTFEQTVERLSAPTLDQAIPDENGVELSWSLVEGAVGYLVLYSFSRNPQVSGSNTPEDQEEIRTRDTKVRIPAKPGTKVRIAVFSVDKYARRSIDVSRTTVESGRVSDIPEIHSWEEKFVGGLENGVLLAQETLVFGKKQWTQPIAILGMSVTMTQGVYLDGASFPPDGSVSDHPVKIRLARGGEASLGASIDVSALNVEFLRGTKTNPTEDALLTVPAGTLLDFQALNEHPTYDLSFPHVFVEIFYIFTGAPKLTQIA